MNIGITQFVITYVKIQIYHANQKRWQLMFLTASSRNGFSRDSQGISLTTSPQ